MGIVALVFAAAMGHSAPLPALWLDPRGQFLVEGKVAASRLSDGARMVRTPLGLGLDLSGTGRAGMFAEDAPALRLTGSLTVSTWVYVRRYASNNWQSEVLFRGDDRPGYDPFHLMLEAQGTIAFGIDDRDGFRTQVRNEIPLNTWVHITGVYDQGAREIRLWVNERMVATSATQRVPLAELDARYLPGIGIGNVESDQGANNQPMDGMVADLRVYGAALDPQEAGYRPVFRNAG